MPNPNEGTVEGVEEGATGEPTPEQEPAQKSNPLDEQMVTTLTSRISGLDAKVTSLLEANKAAEKRAADAEAKLADYEQGKIGAEEALAAQTQRFTDEINRLRDEAKLAIIQGKYPETFSVLGDAAKLMTEDQLAQAEARFKGVVAPTPPNEPEKPIGNSPARTQGAAGEQAAKPDPDSIEAATAAFKKELTALTGWQ